MGTWPLNAHDSTTQQLVINCFTDIALSLGETYLAGKLSWELRSSDLQAHILSPCGASWEFAEHFPITSSTPDSIVGWVRILLKKRDQILKRSDLSHVTSGVSSELGQSPGAQKVRCHCLDWPRNRGA